MNAHWLDKVIEDQKCNRGIIDSLIGFDNACLISENPEETFNYYIDLIVERNQNENASK